VGACGNTVDHVGGTEHDETERNERGDSTYKCVHGKTQKTHTKERIAAQQHSVTLFTGAFHTKMKDYLKTRRYEYNISALPAPKVQGITDIIYQRKIREQQEQQVCFLTLFLDYCVASPLTVCCFARNEISN
jgi:hypothetical protein